MVSLQRGLLPPTLEICRRVFPNDHVSFTMNYYTSMSGDDRTFILMDKSERTLSVINGKQICRYQRVETRPPPSLRLMLLDDKWSVRSLP